MKKITIVCISAILLVLVVIMSGCGYQWHDFETYAKWLKEDNDFDSAESLNLDEPYGYEAGFEFYSQIVEKYKISDIAGNGTTKDKTLNVLKGVSDNVRHDGSQMVNLDRLNGYTLLEYGFGTGKGMNCYCLAIVMTDCMQALGIKARSVLLMPKEYNTGDNHAVTHVYLEEEQKWIMVDPSWNSYFTNEVGIIMDVFELRDAFAYGDKAELNDDANYNGDKADENYYKKYMAKNLYWFQIMLYHDTYNCVPMGFDLAQWNVNQLKWRIKNGMKVDNEKQLIEYYEQCKYTNLNKDDFLKP